ncbi:MAG: bifunctional riboflavin kinase/FAD synthetase [Lachnospiraceae bacterium]|nr:bifunctional riboflavin kinase/FAD synthetase [Lachnospiraceae bacterium]
MVIIENTLHFHIDRPTVVAIGKFDGIHKGHMEIIRRMLPYKKQGLSTAILTFSVSPASVLSKSQPDASDEKPAFPGKLLTTNREKRKIFSELGIDHYIELPFNEEVMKIGAEAFIKQILLERIQMRAIVCGSDCRFGYRGEGDTACLERLGRKFDYETVIADKAVYEGVPISSSLIREELLAGHIETANEMLMRPYLFYGEVVHGRQIGRTLGMPTVNLIPEAEKLLPPSGVYYSRVTHMGQEYRAITNLGAKPTIDGEKPSVGVESYLYGFDEEIYGDFLYVSLYHYVRKEMKFANVDALKAQMQKDIASGEEYHRKHL